MLCWPFPKMLPVFHHQFHQHCWITVCHYNIFQSCDLTERLTVIVTNCFVPSDTECMSAWFVADINECEEQTPCPQNLECLNTPGSFICSGWFTYFLPVWYLVLYCEALCNFCFERYHVNQRDSYPKSILYIFIFTCSAILHPECFGLSFLVLEIKFHGTRWKPPNKFTLKTKQQCCVPFPKVMTSLLRIIHRAVSCRNYFLSTKLHPPTVSQCKRNCTHETETRVNWSPFPKMDWFKKKKKKSSHADIS